MLWILLFLILCIIASLLWVRHQQDREWQREVAYFRRHESGRPAPLPENVKEARDIRGANPNLQNSRSNQKAAEESRAVYTRTVEKLREVAPKRNHQKLDALLGKLDPDAHSVDELPIFAGTADAESLSFAEVPESPNSRHAAANRLRQTVAQQQQQVRTSDNNISIGSYLADSANHSTAGKTSETDSPIITAEELMHPASLPHFHRHEVEIVEFERDPEMLRTPKKPAADLPVITLEEATRNVHPVSEAPQPVLASRPVKTITLDDPAVERTRARTIAEVNKLYQENFRPELQGFRHTPRSARLIDESDIHSNLQWQQLGHYSRQQENFSSFNVPEIIPADEVFANLARNNAPGSRRLRRQTTPAPQNNGWPSTQVESFAAPADLVRPRPMVAAGLNKPSRPPLYQPSRMPAAAVKTNPAPDATVVEPPPVPETPAPQIDIPPPPAFSEPPQTHLPEPPPPPPVNAHITDHPEWSISDRLISESEDDVHPFPSFGWESDTSSFQVSDEELNSSGYPAFIENTEADEALLNDIQAAVNADLTVPTSAATTHHHAEEPAFGTLPDVSLLMPPQFDSSATQSEEALLENSITIEEKLGEFKVKVKVVDAYAGPVITRYEIEPDVGVRGNAVLNLEKDLARSLGVASIRVVETIPGKTCMGLELPNPKRQVIRLSEIFNSPQFRESRSKLTLALGQNIIGEPVVTDLAKAPHLLVAGTTGSGKSVGVNAMILSMLYKASPEDVRMIMIDPKMLELSIYEGIPHLLAPVVTDMRLAANALTWCVNEMEKRYRLMSHLGVRNLAGYNEKILEAQQQGRKIRNPFSLNADDPEPLEKLPFIVVVVDEFADLMMTAGKKIEELIARIAQKARASGIHLILATQRPSVDVITGLIKANIPTRIAFQVSSKVDSRTILDQMGAENLLGQGDMLFLPPGTGYPQRVHGAFVQDNEVHAVVDFLKQTGEPDYIEDILTAGVGGDDIFSNAPGAARENERDELYDEAVAAVIKSQKPTISSLQRFLRIGYNRAATLIDQMEADGIISPPDHANKRTILARHNEQLDG
ncbi:MAG: DNA translocase FtsK [Neisseria sp.]|uniref:DNA translocase FtsK n=1 Tax=Neisseria sp. TaxID=192066 RepID=UPI0026DC8A64|nr:DNA translocase FtsK [Neisseria sp.]MDO4247617.1 DNA translocase FtsK [Neisseria sp.]